MTDDNFLPKTLMPNNGFTEGRAHFAEQFSFSSRMAVEKVGIFNHFIVNSSDSRTHCQSSLLNTVSSQSPWYLLAHFCCLPSQWCTSKGRMQIMRQPLFLQWLYPGKHQTTDFNQPTGSCLQFPRLQP